MQPKTQMKGKIMQWQNLRQRVYSSCLVACFIALPACANPEKPVPKKEQKDETPKKEKKVPMPALQFKMDDIEGKEQDLRQYHGNVILMVNVASKCGLTPQYDELQKLYDKYHDQGFEILGFPANNFLGQEPGSDEEIKQFCRKNYGVTFPMFSKISVKGKDKCDLYKYLTDKKADHEHGGGIKWNFGKFLIDRDGKVIDRFGPRTKPLDEKLVASLQKQLAKDIPADSPLAKKRKEEKEKDKDGDKDQPEKKDS